MAGAPTIVGLDVGTTGVKALALSTDGDVLATATRGYELATPQPGWAEQDPDDWLRAAESALAEVAAGRDVAGIGLSGQMHGLVVLDDAGRVIRPAILWNDQRTAFECAEIEERIGLERLIALTGNRALPGFTAPKLLWLRRHEPEAYARIARVMLPKDYVRLGLTGEWAIDASDASGTLLLDVARRDWSGEVVDALEIPAAWLPPVLESPASAGTVVGGGGPPQVTVCCKELRSRRVREISPRPPSGSARSGPGRSRSCSAPRGSCSRRSPRTSTTPRPACTRSATPCPRRGRRWA